MEIETFKLHLVKFMGFGVCNCEFDNNHKCQIASDCVIDFLIYPLK